MRMPPRMAMPIPVYTGFDLPQEMDRDGVRSFLKELIEGAPPAWRDRIIHLLSQDDLPDDAYYLVRPVVIAWEHAHFIKDVVRHAERVAASTEDALEIDDQFLLYINPEPAVELYNMAEIYNEIDPAAGRETREWWDAVFAEWIKKRQPLYPEVDIEDAVYKMRDPTPPCWHAVESHADIVRGRGQRYTPRRRVATWGTYCIAWVVGTSTLAVRLWNQLTGPEYRWGNPNDPAQALSKYTDAKKRLVDDLRAIGGQRIIPERVRLRPAPPLDSEVVRILEAVVRGDFNEVGIRIALAVGFQV